MSPDWDTVIGWALVLICVSALVAGAMAAAIHETRPQRGAR